MSSKMLKPGDTAVLEQFTSSKPFDMDNDFLIFEPNGSGGYDVTSIPGFHICLGMSVNRAN